ncbi:unnamed protein product [Didymodactylos carnosus]|uniref:Plant heme peroxidase family profile domain-containing protein n=1 Tax=Didymodactylos carnosus TaxID=1234261 RepID=A0A8S2P0K2_9BILA|nr:unnamed protein product [Didymodactylos carnosus]CAF4029738.1 unnamed protein product [Didymodactylos carnosus]
MGTTVCGAQSISQVTTPDNVKRKVSLVNGTINTSSAKTSIDYNAVANAISALIPDPTTKDGYGPLFVRLARHSCATYSKTDNSGGSNGAFTPRQRLGQIKQDFPLISYADLYVLCGVVAISQMGGPKVPFRPGRVDIDPNNLIIVQQANRFPLPEDSKETMHAKFRLMGFGKKEMVTLLDAYCLGRCYTDRSGFDGPWVDHPTKFTNEYFKELIENGWKPAVVPETGKRQFEAFPKGEKLMMLPTDMHLVDDSTTREFVELYANNEQKIFDDFTHAFGRLLEFGVPGIDRNAIPYTF